jgi:hypothetical protein
MMCLILLHVTLHFGSLVVGAAAVVAQADALPPVSLRPPPMQMLCCWEHDGSIRGCYVASMVVFLVVATDVA